MDFSQKVSMDIREQLIDAVNKVEAFNSEPYILFVHPSEKEKFIQALKDTRCIDMVQVREYPYGEIGKAIIMEQKKIDELYRIKFIDDQCEE